MRREYCLTLAGFEPRILLVDHVNTTLAADDAAVLVTLLERPEGVANLHDTPSRAKNRPFGPSSVEGAETMQATLPCQPAKGIKKSSFSAKKSPNRCTNSAMTRRSPPLTALQRLTALAGALLMAACAATPPRHAPVARPPITVPIGPQPGPPGSGNPKFDAFLAEARKTALAKGITAQTFDAATAGIAPVPAIAAMNANQPEFSKPVWSYLDSAVSARRIADAKIVLARYGDVLTRIEATSGVSKEILVAIWGMETDYGSDTGHFNLFSALATLAYDGPRADYARPEFFAALKLYQEQHYPLSEMVASWAGAFGQTQFTPTTFFKYATDGDGDGRIDLWASAPDALASSARLLADQGWRKGEPWGYEVKLPNNFPYEQADTETQKTVAAWGAMGVTTVDGSLLPQSNDSAGIYLPAGAQGPAFLVLPNFSVILKYNNAASYALAVGLLADRMAGGPPVKHSWPRDERPLSRAERIQFQTDLTRLGFDTGTPDGVLGRKSRAALRLYQKSKGLPADGFATASLLTALDKDADAL
jgi:membrane-bound lytic murein transglycosylase B